MKLSQLVIAMITERGCGTVDHLMPDLSEMGYTRLQAIKALQNARNDGHLWCEKVPRGRGGAIGRATAKPGVYWPGKKPASMYAQLQKPAPARPRVASVFELANPRTEWPADPAVRQVCRPLGGWNSEESTA
jgi:hypothetical protein